MRAEGPGVAVHVLGDVRGSRPAARAPSSASSGRTRDVRAAGAHLCISYSSARAGPGGALLRGGLKGVKRLEDIDEDASAPNSYRAWSDPDLLIRTSGECRSPISCCGSSPTPTVHQAGLWPTSRGATCSRRSSTTKGGSGGSAGSPPDMVSQPAGAHRGRGPGHRRAVIPVAGWLGARRGLACSACSASRGVRVRADARHRAVEWVGFIGARCAARTYW